ncbi:MAG: chlorophyll synthesis pathway protein BchC, partial [Alphaproteobacteria bacterium]|nr:chlorophyll synthesis pathway protein BchC [Alphaproteobacteria bacterium]
GVIDASGDANILDTLVGRIARGAEIILAGFYHERLNFAFPPAFMKEARIRIAAEWKPADITTVNTLLATGALKLDGLITHQAEPAQATAAYRTAFTDPACLKMVLDWRHTA